MVFLLFSLLYIALPVLLAHLFYSKYNESKEQCSCLQCALSRSSHYVLHLEEGDK